MKLSIIIPCYNCEKTLREAVDSCYKQSFSDGEFEIVMVDDGSSDKTIPLMQMLANEHDNIRLFYHEENKGGGAARNTGIAKAEGELIYCLDSDNIFASNSVKSMIEFLESEKVDGVAFYERRFFFGENLNRYNTHINAETSHAITLIDIFKQKNILLDNFLYTKKSYLKTDGYPEHHGFDTQCFELRYLSVGNQVKVCPNSIFYHRQGMDEPSYFERVHNSGMFSVNFMLIFEDIFHLFTPVLQKELIHFPIFVKNKSYDTNVFNLIRQKTEDQENIFIDEMDKYLIIDGQKKWLDDVVENDIHSLINTMYTLRKQNYIAANTSFTKFIELTQELSPYLEFLSLRILHGLAGYPYASLVKATLSDLQNMQVINTKKYNILRFLARKNKLIYTATQHLKKIMN